MSNYKYVITVKYVTNDYYWWDDEWKSYLSDDFEDNVVVIGNRDVSGIEEATWWKDAKSLINELENNYYDLADFKYQFSDQFAEDKLEDVYKAYEDCRSCDDPDFMAEICEILYPWLKLSTTTIRGSVQREWANAIYVDGSVDMDIVEDWYFGNVYDIDGYAFDEADFADDEYAMELLEDGDYETLINEGYLDSEGTCPITSTEYFRLGDKKTGLAQYLGIPADSIVAIIED